MAKLNQHSMKNKITGIEKETSPPDGLLAMKHLYSAAILNSFIKPAAGKLNSKELKLAIKELLPGPAERIPMKN